MKYLYIAGLEHSGTTLLNHLLSQHPDAIGLGEVSAFFTPHHMQAYMEKWGDYDDVRLCSCGEDWDACKFWGGISELNGLATEWPLKKKYQRLISHIQDKYGERVLVIDCSKNIETLKMLRQNQYEFGLKMNDLVAVLIIKDVRNFATSIYSKPGSKRSLVNYLKTFNWWLGVNRRYLLYLQQSGIRFETVLYEQLCRKPHQQLARLFEMVDMEFSDEISMDHNHSHIAMGNKNFIMRNREGIEYDNRWFQEDGILGAYLLHTSARRFNKKLHQFETKNIGSVCVKCW